jgi:hypothetical protein
MRYTYPSLGPQHARGNARFVDVESTTTPIHHLHHVLPTAAAGRSQLNTLLRVLSVLQRPPFVVRQSVRVILICGLHPRQSDATSTPLRHLPDYLRLASLFIIRCRPKDDDLLISQRHERIDAGGAASRQITRSERSDNEYAGNGDVGQRISGRDSE